MKVDQFPLRILLVCAFGLCSGCFKEEGQSAAASSASEPSQITASDFSGASSAKNTITGIQINWPASSVTPTSYRVYRVNGTKMTLLATLSSTVTSFIDGTVTWGTIYTYIVRAVDAKNIEDANTSKVSALAWAGISSAEASGRNSITVTFANAVAVVDEIRIYMKPASGGENVLMATVSGSDTSTTISGLRTGFTYIVSAQAYIGSLRKEDGNTGAFRVTTNTLGYHDDGASTAKWLNVMNVRAFGASPSAPLHPSTPDRTPTTELVELSFRAFNGMPGSTEYVVTRAREDLVLDTSVQTLCETTTTSSCRVKCSNSSTSMSGTGILNCRDLKAGPSPARYRYTMSIVHTDGLDSWTEPLPTENRDSFSILVPMPPANMVLVQRDAVNYEMCQQMNSAVDPKNHNRCPHTGVGAVPFNAGPGKPMLTFDPGYYDFGYNLFADRFVMGCKWTTAASGGMCGPGGASGDCIGYGISPTAPSNTIGKNGDVFLMMYQTTSRGELACYYKYNGSWVRSSSVLSTLPDGPDILGAMYTADPSANQGKIAKGHESQSQYQTWTACQAQVDTNYGPKRLPRMREYRAYATFATMPDDLYNMSFNSAWTLANGNSFSAANGYRCPVNSTTANFTYPTDVSQLLMPTNEMISVFTGGTVYGGAFSLGAVANVDCQGRYGLQDPMDLWQWQWVSDNFNWDSTTKILTGINSLLDSGNRDLKQDINGGQTGYVIDSTTASPNGSVTIFTFQPATVNAVNFISIPLGLPVLSTSSTVYLSKNSLIDHYYPSIYFSTAGSTPRSARVNSRYRTAADVGALSAISTTGFRCVMSAD